MGKALYCYWCGSELECVGFYSIGVNGKGVEAVEIWECPEGEKFDGAEALLHTKVEVPKGYYGGVGVL